MPYRAVPMSASASSTFDAAYGATAASDAPREAASPTPSADDDRLLMERFRAGDQSAFSILYARYRGPLRRFVTSLCHDPEDTAEVFQEVWMAVIRARRSYRYTAKFTTWLFSIALRRLADRSRRRGRRGLLWNEDPDPLALEPLADEWARPIEDWMRNVELHQALATAIDRLPPPQRAVFLMKAEGELTLEEIATAMGTSFETTKSRMRYAVARLRAQLEGWK